MRIRLTDEQRRAAATSASRAFIEAAPGSGKTTVAAERFGVVRFDGNSDGRGVIALSFARSARGELEHRVARRWGIDAMRWPHKVWTLDSLHCAIVMHLLRTGEIEWPGRLTDITVLDTWRGISGSRPLNPSNAYYRVAGLNGRRVYSLGAKIKVPYVYGFGTKPPHERALADGICTHDEIRQVLAAALADEQLRAAIRDYLAGSAKAMIVDEVFDGNVVDLRVVYLAADAGVPTTIIGDPWQALYGFRGARPELVPTLTSQLSFEVFPVSASFRFQTTTMQDLAVTLRSGLPVTLPSVAAAEVDVVLARHWRTLWEGSDDVLPFSFGQIGNQTDAAVGLLLDQLVSRHFGQLSTFGPEAAVILGLEPSVVRAEGADAFAPALVALAGGTEADAQRALTLTRQAASELGSPRAMRRLARDKELIRVQRLVQLARRLGKRRLVPGMTVHQAKGREWKRVGVHVTAPDAARLSAGLSQDKDDDRVLYVALTRARDLVGGL